MTSWAATWPVEDLSTIKTSLDEEASADRPKLGGRGFLPEMVTQSESPKVTAVSIFRDSKHPKPSSLQETSEIRSFCQDSLGDLPLDTFRSDTNVDLRRLDSDQGAPEHVFPPLWRFPEMGGTSKSSIFSVDFPFINQAFWGIPHDHGNRMINNG